MASLQSFFIGLAMTFLPVAVSAQSNASDTPSPTGGNGTGKPTEPTEKTITSDSECQDMLINSLGEETGFKASSFVNYWRREGREGDIFQPLDPEADHITPYTQLQSIAERFKLDVSFGKQLLEIQLPGNSSVYFVPTAETGCTVTPTAPKAPTEQFQSNETKRL